MLLPLSAETASANAVLPYLLRRSCRRYPTFRALNEKLSSLYGASLQAQVYKLGEVQVLAVSAVGLDDRYALEKEEVAGELAELLCSILFDPAFENGQFRQEDIDQEKRQLIEQIDSEFNDKRIYAQIRCEELMCRDEAFGVGRFGTKKQVEALTGGEIYSAWRRALSQRPNGIDDGGRLRPAEGRGRVSKGFCPGEQKGNSTLRHPNHRESGSCEGIS